MRTLETLATLLVGLVIVYWAPTSVTPVRAFETVAPQTTSALDGLICAQKDRPKINDGGRLWLLGDPSDRLLVPGTKAECEYFEYMSMLRGYHAMLEKVGKNVKQLEEAYGDVERGLIALGCDDQAPGLFHAVARPGDKVRDFWCARKVRKRNAWLLPSTHGAPTQPDRNLVHVIQSYLRERGLDVGPLDGLMGPRTRTAIVTYQRKHGLTPDGIPSISLLNSLKSNARGQDKSANAGYIVELSAFGTAEETMRERKRIQEAYSDLLGETKLTVVCIGLGEGVVQYQVQASHFPDRLTANYMCARVRARKGYCQLTALSDAKTTNDEQVCRCVHSYPLPRQKLSPQCPQHEKAARAVGAPIAPVFAHPNFSFWL